MKQNTDTEIFSSGFCKSTKILSTYYTFFKFYFRKFIQKDTLS